MRYSAPKFWEMDFSDELSRIDKIVSPHVLTHSDVAEIRDALKRLDKLKEDAVKRMVDASQ